jgi:transposase
MSSSSQLSTALPAQVAPAEQVEEYPGGYVRHEWRMIVELKLQNPSVSVKEIAKNLGRSTPTIYAWYRNPDFQRYENWALKTEIRTPPSERPEEDIRKFQASYTMEMHQRLLDILDETEDLKLQEKIASDWIDRSGFGAKREAKNVVVNISDASLSALITRAKEAGLALPALPAHGHSQD